MGDISANSFELVLFVIAMLFLLFVLLGVAGLVMRHFIRPMHDRIWKHKRKKEKSFSNLFSEGLLFFMMIIWFPFIILLTFGGLYIAITSLIAGDVLKTIIGFLFTIFFGAKFWFMFEHKEHAKKRWAKNALKKSKRKK